MIDLSEPTLHKYRRKVLEIYRELERNPWAPLGIFESKLRKINILNSKIKNVSSDIGKPEGEYSNFTNDNYMQYGFKKKTPLKRTPIKKTPWDKAKKEQEKKKVKAGLSKPALIKRLDRWFSLYVRLRDVNEQGVFQCPTCRRILPFSKGDASHYWSRTHMSTRFDPQNVVLECSFDNRFNSSHLIYLGKYLEKKLGSKKMELLEWKHRQAKNWSLFELQELIEFYKKEVERLKKEKHYDEWAKNM